MIEIRNEDVVLTRRTADGRFVLFSKNDVRPEWTLPWWCAVADTGGNGFGFLARIDADAALAGWLARDLLLVIRTRCALVSSRRPHLATSEMIRALDTALFCIWERGSNLRKPGTQPPSLHVGGQAGRMVTGNPHVFPSRVRKEKPLDDVRREWERVKKLTGLPASLRMHDLRHSFASALANWGIPLNEIGVVLGHTQLSTTARYAHHAP